MAQTSAPLSEEFVQESSDDEDITAQAIRDVESNPDAIAQAIRDAETNDAACDQPSTLDQMELTPEATTSEPNVADTEVSENGNIGKFLCKLIKFKNKVLTHITHNADLIGGTSSEIQDTPEIVKVKFGKKYVKVEEIVIRMKTFIQIKSEGRTFNEVANVTSSIATGLEGATELIETSITDDLLSKGNEVVKMSLALSSKLDTIVKRRSDLECLYVNMTYKQFLLFEKPYVDWLRVENKFQGDYPTFEEFTNNQSTYTSKRKLDLYTSYCKSRGVDYSKRERLDAAQYAIVQQAESHVDEMFVAESKRRPEGKRIHFTLRLLGDTSLILQDGVDFNLWLIAKMNDKQFKTLYNEILNRKVTFASTEGTVEELDDSQGKFPFMYFILFYLTSTYLSPFTTTIQQQ